jgi:hypothetical protein
MFVRQGSFSISVAVIGRSEPSATAVAASGPQLEWFLDAKSTASELVGNEDFGHRQPPGVSRLRPSPVTGASTPAASNR